MNLSIVDTTPMLLSSYTPLFIDCQSTGASSSKSSLLELAINEKSWVIQQAEPVSNKILKLIGITEDEILQGVAPVDAFRQFKDVWEAASRPLPIAHFATFERQFIQRLYLDHGETHPEMELLCTHRLAKRLFPNLPGYGIKALAGYFGTPIHTGKRAADHVLATMEIWMALTAELTSRNILTMEALLDLYNGRAAKKSKRVDFLISKEKRLSIPKGPGIYKFIDRAGRVLYVGKATSLRQRVNSYFTGGCRRDHRKLEMLAQVVDFESIPVPSPLHAGLLEFDEIRNLSPPYNISFSGSYRNPIDALEFLCLPKSRWAEKGFKDQVRQYFYGLDDHEILMTGLNRWRSTEIFLPEDALSVRAFLNLGLPLVKIWIEKRKLDLAAQLLAKELSNISQTSDQLDEIEEVNSVENKVEPIEGEQDEPADFCWTEDLVVQECSKILRRATLHFLRLKYLRRLARAEIEFYPDAESIKTQSPLFIQSSVFDESDPRRTSLLLHELRRAESKGGRWTVMSAKPCMMPFWVR